MAVFDNGQFRGNPAEAEPGRMQWLVNMTGAATSLGLVLGLGFWGYDLAVRDVTGIPVVRALEGPMRVAPQDPGGAIAAHTGLSVNDIAAEGVAAPLPDQMVLAPRPVDLAAEDQPVAALAQAAATTPAPGGPEVATLAALPITAADPVAPVVPVAPVEQLTETPLPALSLAAASVQATPLVPGTGDPGLGDPGLVEPGLADAALADAPATDSAAVDAAVQQALAEALGTTTEELALVEAVPAGAITRSPRPARRPEGDGEAEAIIPAAFATAPPLSPGEVDVASVAPGTRLVQLGAFDDEAGARREWAALKARFGDLIAPKALVLQTAESGGRSFVRLRAMGFEDEAEARRFCSALLSEDAACIPVAHRP